jgi:hypothetical protein
LRASALHYLAGRTLIEERAVGISEVPTPEQSDSTGRARTNASAQSLMGECGFVVDDSHPGGVMLHFRFARNKACRSLPS